MKGISKQGKIYFYDQLWGHKVMISTRKLIHVTCQNLQVRNTEASSSTPRILLQNNKAPVVVTNDGPCISGLGTFI